MKWIILPALLAFSLLLGTINNSLNPHRVPWTGTQPVYPKPEGWPTLSLSQGLAAGTHEAHKQLVAHPFITGAAAVLLVFGLGLFRRSPASRRRWVKSWLRLGFAALFLTAALPKFQDPAGFAELVAQYQLLPAALVNAFSAWLPALEITAALALLLPFEREAAALLMLLLLMFIVALSQALAKNLGIACGCFAIEGATDAGETWFALMRDVVLLAPAAWLWFKAERRALWRF